MTGKLIERRKRWRWSRIRKRWVHSTRGDLLSLIVTKIWVIYS